MYMKNNPKKSKLFKLFYTLKHKKIIYTNYKNIYNLKENIFSHKT